MSVGGIRRICRNLAGQGCFCPGTSSRSTGRGLRMRRRRRSSEIGGQDPLYGGEEEEKLLGLVRSMMLGRRSR